MKRSEIEMDLNNLKKIKNWGNKNYIVNIKRRYKTMKKKQKIRIIQKMFQTNYGMIGTGR